MNSVVPKKHRLAILTSTAVTAMLFGSSFAAISVPGQAQSITAAMAMAKKGDTVLVDEGIYREHVYVTPGAILMSRGLFKATLDGSGRGTVVTMGSNSTISGFDVRNGTIGIFSTSSGAVISQCRVIYNQQTGIMCVGNLPRIEDNLVVYNRGSGIQGWDVRSTSASVNHNTIAYNTNHGISIGGNSSIIVENNIIANNDQFGVKPSEEIVRVDMIGNSFFQNASFTGVLPTENYELEPLFADPKNLNFALLKESRCIGKGSDSQNLGARIAY